MVHGPEKYGGIGIMDMYSKQGISHIKVLSDEAGTTTPTGNLLNIIIDGHMVEVGRKGNIFDMAYPKIQQELTYSWVQDTMAFAHQHGIKIRGKIPELRIWRQGDTMLMDDMDSAQGISFTKQERRIFQQCRLYLQANTISDITNGNGTLLHPVDPYIYNFANLQYSTCSWNGDDGAGCQELY